MASPLLDRVARLLLILAAFFLRVGDLGRLGLAYDEAATALMSRAAPAAIIAFHWDAAFEHPPVWALIMHYWSAWAGQSELALRLIPAYAGLLVLPLLWRLLRRLWPGRAAFHWTAAILITLSPVLVYYSQEARMYTLVVLLAIVVVLLSLRQVTHPSPGNAAALVVSAWAMLGLHYYSALVLAVLALYVAGVWLFTRAERRPAVALLALYGLSCLPLLFWMSFAPGFRETLEVVLREAGVTGITISGFLRDLWRELSFGAIRWTPALAEIGWVVAPFALGGAIVAVVMRANDSPSPYDRRAGWLIVLMALGPMAFSALALRTLSTRYLLYVAPFLWTLVALAVYACGAWRRSAGVVAFVLVLLPFAGGLTYYRGPYVKSEYREMAHALKTQVQPSTDIVLMEAPRQHLLAKYYLPDDWTFAPVPNIRVPDYWPLTAPPLVPEEEDDRIQAFLRAHDTLWILYSSENEVDKGEFLAKYATAVAYRQRCDQWLDIRVCRYLSPHSVQPTIVTPHQAAFRELLLERSALALTPSPASATDLLLQLDWQALAAPALDYKVSVRLVAPDGAVVAQTDEYPIGALLPPTTWAAGDRKPGYVSLALPPSLAPGAYAVVISVYDPATLAAVPVSAANDVATGAALVLANVQVGDRIQLQSAASPD
jgi:hypothetical protein